MIGSKFFFAIIDVVFFKLLGCFSQKTKTDILNNVFNVYRITPKTFSEWADETVEVFPAAVRELLYQSRITPDRKNNIPGADARGALLDHYKYVRNKLYDGGLLIRSNNPDEPVQDELGLNKERTCYLF